MLETTIPEEARQPVFTRVDDPVELRVLGSLMEKEMSTPLYYPMTVNAITAACNQKNNRDPVVEYDERAVQAAIEGLRSKMLVSTVTGTGYRVHKYKHNATHVYSLSHPESAVICLLLLRGPQTPGELRSRSGSMHPFEDLLQVDAVLQNLAERPVPLVAKLGRIPGQKEARFMHRIAGEPIHISPGAPPGPTDGHPDDFRLHALEETIAALRQEMQALRDQFAEFKKQFE